MLYCQFLIAAKANQRNLSAQYINNYESHGGNLIDNYDCRIINAVIFGFGVLAAPNPRSHGVCLCYSVRQANPSEKRCRMAERIDRIQLEYKGLGDKRTLVINDVWYASQSEFNLISHEF